VTASPNKSRQTGPSRSSEDVAIVHVIQQLLLLDCEKLHFCEWLLFANVEDDPVILDVTSILDEAWFHLISYM
jgi:hypothetical protein